MNVCGGYSISQSYKKQPSADARCSSQETLPERQGRRVMPLGGAVEVVDLIADQGQDGQLGHLAAAALG